VAAWIVRLTGKYKAVVWCISLTAVAAFSYLGIIAPQRERILVLRAQYQTELQQIKTVEAYVQKHPDPEQHLRELNLKVERIDAKLPNQPEIGAFLKETEQLAKQSGIAVAGIKPLATRNKDGYREILIEFKVSGTYVNLLEFMKKLEDARRFNSVVNVNIQAKEEKLDTKIQLAIYSNGIYLEPVPQRPPFPSSAGN
jgi:type IV pilus assembly protein PilO